MRLGTVIFPNASGSNKRALMALKERVALFFAQLDHALDITGDGVDFKVDPALRLEILESRLPY